jgi:hypothetical protein
MAQIRHVCDEMPVIELAVGDEYPVPGAGRPAVTPADLADGKKMLLGQFNGTEIPFAMKFIAGRWRVDPAVFIRMANLSRGGPA